MQKLHIPICSNCTCAIRSISCASGASQKNRSIWMATSLSRPCLLLSSYRHDCESRCRSTPLPAEHSGRCTRNSKRSIASLRTVPPFSQRLLAPLPPGPDSPSPPLSPVAAVTGNPSSETNRLCRCSALPIPRITSPAGIRRIQLGLFRRPASYNTWL